MEENLNIPILENEEMWASRSIDEHNTNVKLLSYSQPLLDYIMIIMNCWL